MSIGAKVCLCCTSGYSWRRGTRISQLGLPALALSLPFSRPPLPPQLTFRSFPSRSSLSHRRPTNLQPMCGPPWHSFSPLFTLPCLAQYSHHRSRSKPEHTPQSRCTLATTTIVPPKLRPAAATAMRTQSTTCTCSGDLYFRRF
jgi:hypothetical protein